MERFDSSIPHCQPGGLDLKEFDAMEDMFHIQVEDKLYNEDWLKCFATKILDAKHETQICFECYRRTKRCLMELLAFIHINRYLLTSIQMPSLCILGLTQYLESI
jgi:hypothetical protein